MKTKDLSGKTKKELLECGNVPGEESKLKNLKAAHEEFFLIREIT